MSRVAVVGAGIAGLAAARELAGRGASVVVFEQARTPGGRMATRRVSDVEKARGTTDLAFDHGAQYFTVRDPRFAQVVDAWRDARLAAPWAGRLVSFGAEGWEPVAAGTERFVGTPGMSAIAAAMAAGLDVRYGSRIDALAPLTSEFDRVILAVPGPRAQDLLRDVPALATRVASVVMRPCWTVMAAFEEPVAVPFDGAFVSNSPLGWVARNTSKPKRDWKVDTWVLHATPAWSASRADDDPEVVGSFLMEAFDDLARAGLPRAFYAATHRWPWATADPPLAAGALHDDRSRITVCGDWCAGSRIEDAYLSGVAAAHAGRVEA